MQTKGTREGNSADNNVKTVNIAPPSGGWLSGWGKGHFSNNFSIKGKDSDAEKLVEVLRCVFSNIILLLHLKRFCKCCLKPSDDVCTFDCFTFSSLTDGLK